LKSHDRNKAVKDSDSESDPLRMTERPRELKTFQKKSLDSTRSRYRGLEICAIWKTTYVVVWLRFDLDSTAVRRPFHAVRLLSSYQRSLRSQWHHHISVY